MRGNILDLAYEINQDSWTNFSYIGYITMNSPIIARVNFESLFPFLKVKIILSSIDAERGEYP